MITTTTGFSRRGLLAGTSALGLGVLAGCSSGAGGAGQSQRVSLTGYKASDSEDPQTRMKVKGLTTFLAESGSELKARFTDVVADSPNATVSKLQTLLLGGQTDIIRGATVYPFYDQGLLIDLQPYYERDGWQANFVPSIFRSPAERVQLPAWSAEPTGKVSSPDSLDTSSIAYDTKLFEDFGVEPLAAQPTIEEVLEKAAALTGRNPKTGQDCYGLYYDPRGSSHLMLAYLAGGLDLGKLDPADPTLLKFDTPEVKKGIEGMVGMAKFCPPGFEIGQGAENWGTAQNTVAINMAVNPAGMRRPVVAGLGARYVVTEGIRDRDGNTPFVGAGEWAISAKATDPDGAWELIKLLSGPEGQAFTTTNYGTIPSWQKADWIDPAQAPYAEAFIACATDAKNVYYPQFMFRTFRPWMAAAIGQLTAGKKVDLDAGLADQQRKAEEWAAGQKERQG